jgi:hypothetical protein
MRSLFEYGLDAVDIAVAVALLSTVKAGRFGPAQSVLATMVGTSERTVRKSVVKLKAAKLLKVVVRGSNQANQYDVTPMRLFGEGPAAHGRSSTDRPDSEGPIMGDRSVLDRPSQVPECYSVSSCPSGVLSMPFGKNVTTNTDRGPVEFVRSTLPRHFAGGVEVQTVDQMMTLFRDGEYDEIVNECPPFGPPPIASRARDEIAMVLLEVTVAFDVPPYKGDIGDLIGEYGVERCWYHANWLATRLSHTSSVGNVCGFFKRSVQGDWDKPSSAYLSVRA